MWCHEWTHWMSSAHAKLLIRFVRTTKLFFFFTASWRNQQMRLWFSNFTSKLCFSCKSFSSSSIGMFSDRNWFTRTSHFTKNVNAPQILLLDRYSHRASLVETFLILKNFLAIIFCFLVFFLTFTFLSGRCYLCTISDRLHRAEHLYCVEFIKNHSTSHLIQIFSRAESTAPTNPSESNESKTRMGVKEAGLVGVAKRDGWVSRDTFHVEKVCVSDGKVISQNLNWGRLSKWLLN